ncbi:putative reverse transcriptase domain-containing protein [Tanacetum coccineum]
MSDLEDSTVTYTEISSPYEDLSDVGSPGAEGPIFQDPPSLDYVPGPEEPEQVPPLPIYVPFVLEPVYPEFLLVDDEVFLVAEQPMPAADSPTHQSPGYIPESDPEEDPEEDDEEDPEEDPADYLADRGDDDDDDDDTEEEHLAPADPAVVAYSADQDPYLAYREVAERLLALPTPPPLPLSPYSSPLPQIPSLRKLQRDVLPSPVHETEMPEICLPLRKRPRRTTPGLGYEVGESSAAGAARQVRPTTARQTLYDLPDIRCRSRMPNHGKTDSLRARVNMLYRDRPFHRRTALLMEEEADSLGRLANGRWMIAIRSAESRLSETETVSGDIIIVKSLKTQNDRASEISSGPAKEPAEPEATGEASSSSRLVMTEALLLKKWHQKKAHGLNPGTTPPPVTDPTTTTSVTSAQLQAMIDEGVTAVLAARATTRNGDDSHTSGTEGVVDLTQWFERMETVFRISNCTVENQVKFATCTLMGTALTWWNSHARTVTNEVAYAMTWSDLKKKMTTKYCPRNEIKKIEAELWNLKVKGTDVVALQPNVSMNCIADQRPMQECYCEATELMDRRNNTFAERQAENKRKFEDTPRNNQNQQPNKRQNTGRAYAAGNGDKKPYEGTKPRCPKCNFNHYGPCIPTCTNCKKLGHLAKDCRSRPATANNNNNRNNNNNNNRNNNNPRAQGANTNAIVCFECGAPGHFKKDCPQWKNKNQGNGNGVARAYAVGVAGQNPDNNVVTVFRRSSSQKKRLEFLQDKRNLINSVQTFLRKFNRFSFYETPKVVSLAWETISEIEHAFEDKQYQPEGILELFRKLHDDVQNIHEELAEYINTPSWNRPTISCDDDDDEIHHSSGLRGGPFFLRAEQAPPSPIYIPFVPEPVYPEFLPVDDEEDDEEDPEEDPADYPADRGDRDDEESFDDDDDAEEEHLAPADPAATERCTTISCHETEMHEICLPLRKRPRRTTPSPGYEVGESSAAGTARQVGPTTARADLYGFADMLDAAPVTARRPKRLAMVSDTWDDLVGAIQEIAPTTLEGVNQRVIELATTVDQEDDIIYSQLDDARHDRALLRARVNMLYRDRPFHRRTALLMEEEARVSRAAWAQSMDACDQVHSEGISLRTTVMAQQSEITELQAADCRRQTMISDLLKADHRRQRQLVEALKIVKSLKT